MTILGRNEDLMWVYMASEDNKKGWVNASLLTIDGDLRRVAVQGDLDVSSLSPATKLLPTQKLPPTSTRKPLVSFTNTPQSLLSRFVQPCSETANKIGELVSCQIERAYCDYFPSVDGNPTFCNDRPYPNQNFALVVFGENWIDYDGLCIIISGKISLYRGVPQILATSRSQVSSCQ